MDYDLWCAEQKADWTLVGSKAKKSFADVVRSNSAPKNPFLCDCFILQIMSPTS
jgi:hypothetical protein